MACFPQCVGNNLMGPTHGVLVDFPAFLRCELVELLELVLHDHYLQGGDAAGESRTHTSTNGSLGPQPSAATVTPRPLELLLVRVELTRPRGPLRPERSAATITPQQQTAPL